MADALHGDSLILWQQTNWFEAYYNGLRPFVHYVPVASDLSDLFAKISWARAHPADVAHIIRNAQRFARQFITAGAATAHLHDVLLRYGNLMAFAPNITEPAFFKVWLHPYEYAKIIVPSLIDPASGRKQKRCPYWKNTTPDWVRKWAKEVNVEVYD